VQIQSENIHLFKKEAKESISKAVPAKQRRPLIYLFGRKMQSVTQSSETHSKTAGNAEHTAVTRMLQEIDAIELSLDNQQVTLHATDHENPRRGFVS
jgi:hypothetical protein